eukprot:1156026-Pelagomonas_calceolata.AAC.15
MMIKKNRKNSAGTGSSPDINSGREDILARKRCKSPPPERYTAILVHTLTVRKEKKNCAGDEDILHIIERKEGA